MSRCADSACGTLWLDPTIVPEDIGLAYRTYYTHSLAGRRGPFYRWYRRLARAWLATEFGYGRSLLATVAALAFDAARREELRHSVLYLQAPAGRVCDVGCGEGARLERLAELGWIGIGVEPDERAAALGRARGIDVRTGLLPQLGFAAGSFDAVTFGHVIEHVPDPLGMLTEARRLLAPGGRLAVATPNAAGLGAARWREAWRGLEPPRHLQVFTPASLLALARMAGFATATVRTTARMAAVIHLESTSGRIAAGRAPFTSDARRAAAEFARAEREALQGHPNAGEEILLEASV